MQRQHNGRSCRQVAGRVSDAARLDHQTNVGRLDLAEWSATHRQSAATGCRLAAVARWGMRNGGNPWKVKGSEDCREAGKGSQPAVRRRQDLPGDAGNVR
ncbi:MAG: hypothetical protein GY938_20140 [Ketobacter sp.]|nr:hypothetical protein [Ketobacter sp.]